MSDVVSGEGNIKAKVLVKDLRADKSHLLNMTVKAVSDGPLRIDITTSLGIHLFSLVTKDDELEYILVRQKKYYKGENTESALKSVLSIPLDPNHLRNVIFQQPIENRDWTCSDKNGVLYDCLNLRRRIKIVWKKDKAGRPLVDIQSPKRARIQINVRDVQDFDGDPDKVFRLKVPKSFRKI